MELISVVIPVYNRASMIGGALQSVIDQSYKMLEIIIVDDNSTDNTLEVIRKFDDPRIRIVQHAHNKGAAAARNSGIKAAKGSMIAFLDSDDQWTESKLQKQLAFVNDAVEDFPVSCTGYILNKLDDDQVIHNLLTHHKNINQSIYEGCDLSPGSTLLVRRTVFEQVGLLDEQLLRWEDWDWLIRYLQFGKIGILHESLAKINHRWSRNGEAHKKSARLFFKKNFKNLYKLGFYKRRSIIANIWWQVGQVFLREGQYHSAMALFIKAHCWDPMIILKYPLQKIGACISC